MPALQADAKIGQYLNEAQATEQALIQTLQAHIAMTPAGSYREALEGHLAETREHSRLVAERLRSAAPSRNPLRLGVWAAEYGVGLVESMTGRMLALWKAPIDMVRGSSGEEKLLKNAKDECASEALEIASYEALERVAEAVGDTETARLARRIRGDEERMLARLRQEIPGLATNVVESEVEGRPSFRADRTGAADAARGAARTGRRAARAGVERIEVAAETGARASRAAGRTRARATRAAAETAAQAAQAAGAAGQGTPAAAPPAAAAQPVEQTAGRARSAARRSAGESRRGARARQADGRGARSGAAPQRSGASRARERRSAAGEPWAGYDEQSVPEIRETLAERGEQTAAQVLEYERQHKDRTTVEQAAERELGQDKQDVDQ